MASVGAAPEVEGDGGALAADFEGTGERSRTRRSTGATLRVADGADATLAARYRNRLRDYLHGAATASLEDAQALGREALASESGILAWLATHREAAGALGVNRLATEDAVRKAAERFFAASLASFDRAHREHRKSQDALRRINGCLENEARRIALLLHEEAAQLLAAAYLELAGIERETAMAAIKPRAARMRAQLDGVRGQLRHISHELSPPALERLGLIPALEFLAEGVHERSALDIAIDASSVCETRLSPPIETTLYRAVQEALNNAVQHAAATHARVTLRCDRDRVICTIADDGRGFVRSPGGKQATAGGLGLIAIRARLQSLGGSLHIASVPERGTTLRISVPLAGNAR
ncbi:MAG TPA: ATP-binding protein [Gammaproteobacteria bacterium]|nr:ATP-binding protein [Gammaproteobacteria bacterium]